MVVLCPWFSSKFNIRTAEFQHLGMQLKTITWASTYFDY